MTLTLHYHPLSSYCHKALIAFYERDVPFECRHLDMMDAATRKDFLALWPVGKMPVLTDDACGLMLPETSLIVEYADGLGQGDHPLLPADADACRDVRLWDRIFDNYGQTPMQKIVTDGFRPDGSHDPHGVRSAEDMLKTLYGLVDARMEGRTWVAGDDFSLADCAAAPVLFYTGTLVPFAADYPNVAAYFERLVTRPSVARVLEEAKPWLHFFPMADRLEARFR